MLATTRSNGYAIKYKSSIFLFGCIFFTKTLHADDLCTSGSRIFFVQRMLGTSVVEIAWIGRLEKLDPGMLLFFQNRGLLQEVNSSIDSCLTV